MSRSNFSRRRFFKKSLYLSSVPLTFSFITSFSAYGETLEGPSHFPLSSSPGVSDLDRIAGLIKHKDPLIWVFTGDSITHGAKHTHGYRSYPEIFEERIRWELGRRRDIIINTGISGNTAKDILDDFDWRISQFKPNVVSIMIGTNDCSKKDIGLDAFEHSLDSLLTRIRELKAIPVFHTPNVIISEKAPERAKLSEFVSVIRSLTEKKEVILIDNYTYWQNAIQTQGEIYIFKNWLNDPLHPNGAGHSEIARLLFKKLSVFDPQAATCGGPYYEGEH